jgi:hypothetical protein
MLKRKRTKKKRGGGMTKEAEVWERRWEGMNTNEAVITPANKDMWLLGIEL